MRKIIITILCSLLGVILSIALVFGFLLWNFNRWPFDLKKLDSFNEKTTTQEVQKTLGKPKSIYYKKNDEGEKIEEWIYSASGAWPIVYIRFSHDGTYIDHETDY
jgi:hypothetical protein